MANVLVPRTAWLDIDLDAIRSNFLVVRALAGGGVPVHPVVKADAYGHGAIPIARALAEAGADGLCVATMDEALALRRAGIGLDLLVLYGVPPEWGAEAARRRIAVTAGDPQLLEATLRALVADGQRRRLGVELEVETGLGRGGFAPGELVAAARLIVGSPVARLRGVWTHLAAPEDPDSAATQAGRFAAACDALREAGIRLPPLHLRATGSLVTGDLAASGGVRPGLSIYGLLPDEVAPGSVAAAARALRPALSLRARPVRVADLAPGWGVSYGPSFRTARTSRIATLPLGYGDGWSRALSNRAWALVRGVRVPLVGNVAMDAVMADVTDVPGSAVSVDDEFVLIGQQGGASITVADVARARTTNAWEVVTTMARRLPRVYHAAAGPTTVRTLVSGGDG